MGAGRPKKYTAAEFEAAVERYFARVSRTREMKGSDGAVVYDDEGEAITYIEWLRPPTISGLCLALGIDRSTWQNYADRSKNPRHAPVCEQAKMRIECYLEELLSTKERSVQGVIFNLQANYWSRERAAAEQAEGRRSVLEGMSMAEKLALIREMGGEGCNGGEEKANESAN